MKASLLLADGSRYDGEGLSVEGVALGEAVFYTGMTGYEEALTDPSYAGQILTFTYPMIGNYGVCGESIAAQSCLRRRRRHQTHFAQALALHEPNRLRLVAGTAAHSHAP